MATEEHRMTTTLMDKADARAAAIQARRMTKIIAMLAILKGADTGEEWRINWPHPAEVEAMDDRAWDGLAQVASRHNPTRFGPPSDETKRQLLAIYRTDYRRHVMEAEADEPADPFDGLDQ